jgi:hypothetical protein
MNTEYLEGKEFAGRLGCVKSSSLMSFHFHLGKVTHGIKREANQAQLAIHTTGSMGKLYSELTTAAGNA